MTDEPKPATDELRARWNSGDWYISGHGTSTDPDSDEFSLLVWIDMLDARINAEKERADEAYGEAYLKVAAEMREAMETGKKRLAELEAEINRAKECPKGWTIVWDGYRCDGFINPAVQSEDLP